MGDFLAKIGVSRARKNSHETGHGTVMIRYCDSLNICKYFYFLSEVQQKNGAPDFATLA